ncbi:MAG: hypothetical protein BWK80_42870 [Desulfobacteraceae bacterium IS3]|nr:MAG: hypothetical protein BWK80_42870 [Desulfobacteraceae bacterium IS3]
MENLVKTETFLISLLALFLTETVGAFVLSFLVRHPTVAQILLRSSQVSIFILIFLGIEKNTASLGLTLKQIVPGLKSGVIWSLLFGMAVFFVSALLFFIGKIPPDFLSLRFPQQAVSEIFLLLTLRGIVGPVAEEVFFRGILYGFLRRWGFFPALFLSSFLFVFAHQSGGFPQIVGAVLFAAAYETEKNLMVPITIHILGNIALFLLSPMFAR